MTKIKQQTRNILPVCSSYIAKELNWTRQDEGLVMGIFFWGYMLTQFAGGYFSDVFGGEMVLPLTAAIWGFFYPGLASLMAKRVQMSERQFTYSFITSGSHAG
ncbi:hypothetical protein ACTXT7_014152 [Hymenolepis weldensis]